MLSEVTATLKLSIMIPSKERHSTVLVEKGPKSLTCLNLPETFPILSGAFKGQLVKKPDCHNWSTSKSFNVETSKNTTSVSEKLKILTTQYLFSALCT